MQAKRTDGKPYQGNQLYQGRGVLRSCSKCGEHVQTGQLKMLKPWGLSCEPCRLPSVRKGDV